MKKIFVLLLLLIGMVFSFSCEKPQENVKTYKVQYVLEYDETLEVEEPDPENAEVGSQVTLVDVEYPDYTFSGWFLNSDYTGDSYTTFSSDEEKTYTFYGKLEEIIYEAALKVQNKISYLPKEITLAKETAVNYIKAEYDALSDIEKAHVKNYQVLVAALEKIQQIHSTDDIVAFIENLKGEYLISDYETLNSIQNQINNLSTVAMKYLNDNYGSNLNDFTFFYKQLTLAIEEYTEVINLINEIPSTLTLSDNKVINKARLQYNKLSDDQKLYVSNYEVLENAEKTLEVLSLEFSDVVKLINALDKDITLADKAEIEKARLAYDTLDASYKAYVDNLSILEIAEDKYQACLLADKICCLYYVINEDTKQEILNVKNEFDSSTDSVKSYVVNTALLEYAVQRVEKYDSTTRNVTYVMGSEVVLSKSEFGMNFWNALYSFIYTYGDPQELVDKGVNSPDDFYTMSIDFDGGRNHLYNLGDNFGSYLLSKDINGIIENQPTTKFFGYAYQHGLFKDSWSFLIRFFAYWRLDEQYASLSNYGADTFAESWAPTVDFCKFFYYTPDTCIPAGVATPRMVDCLEYSANVAYGNLDNNLQIGDTLPTITLRDYTFVGWYENSDFSGEAITTVTKNNLTVYAKFVPNTEEQEKDAAALVDVYTYNLTTKQAVVNKTTVGYVYSMYQALSANAKKQVTYIDKLKALVKQYLYYDL